MKNHWMRPVAVILFVCVTGCQTVEPASELEAGGYSIGANVALVTGRIEPKVNVTAIVRGASDAAAKGASAGAGSCLNLSYAGGGEGIGGGIAALAMIICLPIATAVGAIKTSSEAAPEKDLERAEARLRSILQSFSYQKALGDHMSRYAGEVGLAPFVLLGGQGPSRPDDVPSYQSPETRSVDSIIEVAITDITARTSGSGDLPYTFLITARGRLVRVGDHAVLDSFESVVMTSRRSLDELMANGAKLLAADLDRGYRDIAEAFVDEWLLIDHRLRAAPGSKVLSDGTSATDDNPVDQVMNRRIPAYVLHPIYPELKLAGFFRGIPPRHLGPLDPVQVGTLRPTLRWETFPRTYDLAGPVQAQSKPHSVTYDLRIFRGQKFYFPNSSSPLLAPAAPVLIERGLVEPHYTPVEPLEPCTLYFWTVRAEYVTEGRSRATEWSGSYNRGLYPGRPWRGRRTMPQYSLLAPFALPNEFYYFPLMTPPSEGQKCEAP